MIFAVDFDGTLVTGDTYPDPHRGKPNWPLANKIKQLQLSGHEVVLWTCRSQHYLETAIDYCEEVLDIHFDRINESSPKQVAMYDNLDPRKIGADYYIDDKCISPEEFLKLEV